ncbi:DUF748 domain-containing protein [Pseudidiomarina insulisalsae]|uniref:DUF748 domain-containing protein n=1 Tax=Pseudidiomarina insulisalsae TaxID=575789 RepID=A0A432YLI4_9GAMM|nr:DUF748 domain-containing protein [Pseudidiomarina insulisalsae]RUO61800.1 hypothetical protein CWI71_05415 [Pseudidiomarina insulisalsae]
MDRSSMQRLGCYLRMKWLSPRRVRFWLLALLVLYTLFGFFGLPWVVQSFAKSTVQEDFGRSLQIESVQTNPFTLNIQVNGLALADRDGSELLGWDELFVDFAWSSITNQAWTFTIIRLEQPVVHEERFASGETRWLRFVGDVSSDQTTTAPASEPAALPALRVNKLQVNDGVVRFTDHLEGGASAEASQVSLALQSLGLTVTDFTLQEGARFPLRVNGELRDGGTLTFDGSMQVLPNVALDVNADVNALALAQAEPYVRQFANVRLESGTLSLNGQLLSDAQQPLAFEGAAGVDGLSVKNALRDEALIGWQRVATEKVRLSLKDQQLQVDPVTVQGLTGRIVIYEDQTTNFGQLVADRRAEAGAAAGDSQSADDGSDEGANGEGTAPPLSVAVARIDFSDGAIHFADNSLPLPFSERIHTLNGEISTLNSSSAEPAKVTLQGEVAEYGLANVDGAIHAWHPTRDTRLRVKFRNLQVPEYSPYTVNFAGRKIAGGTMDVDLDYSIEDSQLDGENNLVLHDLKLGEKMAASDAMDLPLDLAIALLQDSNGVIDLSLPVSGDVNNPQFDIGAVIRQAIGKAITSVVTAPFRFLANLVGAGSEELSQVEFAAGSAELLAPQRQRIAKLREALQQRPQLVLELAGPYERDFDAPVMQRQQAASDMQQRLAEAGRADADPGLTLAANQELLEAMFLANYPGIQLEMVRADFTSPVGEDSEEVNFDALAYRNYLAERVVAAQVVTDADLYELANARAQAVRDALTGASDAAADAAPGIAAERVRIMPPDATDAMTDERIAMEAEVSAG